jgi:hypothetical protein
MTAGAGLIHSDDDSCSWQAARGTLSGVLPFAFTVDASSPKRVYAIGMPRDDFANGDSIYVSDDGGLSFGEPVFTSPPRSALLTLLVAPSLPSRLFATMFVTPDNHPILLRSDDSGEHWDVVSSLVEALGENPFELLAIDLLDADTLYVRVLGASAETLATSHDGGLSFVPLVSIAGKLNAFLKLASGTLLVGGTAGTDAVGYRSNDDGQTFEPWPAAPHVHALAERSGKLYVAGDPFADGYAIAESEDEGAQLSPLAGFEQVQAVKSCVADLCTDSCAYYAGIGLWPAAVCGAVSTSPLTDTPDTAALPDATAGANATGEKNSGEAEPDGPPLDTPADDGGSAVSARPERGSVRISGGGCACDVRRQPADDWTARLILGAMLVARRKARRSTARTERPPQAETKLRNY